MINLQSLQQAHSFEASKVLKHSVDAMNSKGESIHSHDVGTRSRISIVSAQNTESVHV